jgi:ferredoxin
MFRSATNKFCSKIPKQNGWRRIVPPSSTSPTSVSTDNYRCIRTLSSSIPCWNDNNNDNNIVGTRDTLFLKRLYSSTPPNFDANEKKFKTVSITYLEADGTSKTVDADVGTDLMTTAHENDIELEGACGGELACSTCHLIFEQDVYDSLPEKGDEEDDMLDLAFEVTDTSRLGCQIIVQENFDGTTVKIPDDGF